MAQRPSTSASETLQATRWTIDPAHSDAGFAARHMMISTVRGRFTRIHGVIEFDESDPTGGRVEVEIDAASIDTHSEERDNHLRSADFFDVEHYPTITFASRRVEETGSNRFNVIGDLTIRDVTREVVLDTSLEGVHPDPWGGTRAGFTAMTEINRHDFGLSWNVAIEAGGVLVGDTIRINLDIQAVKAS